MKHSYSIFRKKSVRTVLIVVGSMSVAFVLGIQTAGDIKPVIDPTHADDSVLGGDLNGNGELDLDDVHIALEIADGYRTPTPEELAADPNRDYMITKSDAMIILEQLKQAWQQPIVEL